MALFYLLNFEHFGSPQTQGTKITRYTNQVLAFFLGNQMGRIMST